MEARAFHLPGPHNTNRAIHAALKRRSSIERHAASRIEIPRRFASRNDKNSGVFLVPRLVPSFGFLWHFETLLQILAGFVHGALGVVVGLQGLTIFVGRPFSLPGDIENLA
jgi:hypothetical protein